MIKFINGVGEDLIASMGNGAPLTAGPMPEDVLSRAIGYAATAVPQGVSNLAGSVGNIIGQEGWGFMPEHQPILPSKGFGSVVDFVGAGLLPAAVEIGLTGRATGGILNAAGVTNPLTHSIVRGATEFGMLGAGQDRITGLEQAGEGAAYGALAALPRLGRILPAAALAMGSKAFFDRNGAEPVIGDFSQGDVSAIAGMFAALAPTKLKLAKKLDTTKVVPGSAGPQLQLPGPSGDFIPTRPVNVPEGGIQDGVVYGRASSTVPEVVEPPIIEAQYMGSEPANPLIDIGGASNKFVQLTDFNAPQTEQQILNRTPWRKQTILQGGPAPAYTPPRDLMQRLFDPAEYAALEKMGINPDRPDVSDALQRLQMALFTHATRGDTRSQQIAFAKFFQEMFDRPDYRSPLAGDDAWNEMIQAGTRSVDNPKGVSYKAPEAPLQMNPLTEGDPVGGLVRPAISAPPEAYVNPLMQVPETAPLNQWVEDLTQGGSRNRMEAEAEAARRGKMQQTPEYRRTEGGAISPEAAMLLGRSAVGAAAGYATGELTDNDPLSLALAMGAAAGLGPEFLAKIRASKGRPPSLMQAIDRGTPNVRSTVTPEQNTAALDAWIQQMKGEQEAKINELLQRQREAASKSKINPIPEYRRTEGGFADMDMLTALGGAGVRAAVGGGLGGLAAANDDNPDTDPTSMAMAGAALAAGAPYIKDFVALVQRARGARPFKAGNEMGGIANPFPEGNLPGGLKLNKEIDGNYIRLGVGTDVSDYGYLAGVLKDNTLNIQGSHLHPALRGKKIGLHMYDAMADEAAARQIPLTSDFSVSEAASRVWEAMSKRGFKVERNPEAVFLEPQGQMSGSWVTPDHSPVYRVEKVPTEELATVAKASDSPSGMKRFGREGGHVMPELSSAMARAGVGGFLGATIGGTTDDVNDYSGFVTGGLLGAMAGAFGPALTRSLAEALSKSKTTTAPTAGKASWGTVMKNMGTVLNEKSGAALRGSDKISDRFVRWLDSGLSLTVPEAVKRTLLGAKGQASLLLDNVDKALLRMSIRYNPDQAVKDLTNAFLDGGDKQAYIAQIKQLGANNPDILRYGEFAVAARESMTGLQRMVADGIGDPKMAKIISDSFDKYVSRSYKLFTDPKWKPDEQKMEALTRHMMAANVMPGMGEADIRSALEQYIREAKTIKGVYRSAGSQIGQAIAQSALKERKNLGPEWREFLGEITDPTERIYQTMFKLRPMAESSKYFKDLANVTVDGMPQVFDSYASRDAFLSQTLQRLQNLAPGDPTIGKIATDYINKPTERSAMRQQLLEHLPPSAEKKNILDHLSSLDSFQSVESHPKFGSLKGNLVSRNVWDSLKTYDSVTDLVDHPLLRSVVNAHTAIKLSRTAFNPITGIRNLMTMPMFMAIGKAGPTDIKQAWDALSDPASSLYKEIMQQGISNVDQIKTEFFKEFENITGSQYNFGNLDLTTLGLGKYDLNMAEKVARRQTRNILDLYRLPDNLVRVGSYLGAKRRIAQELGKAIDDPEVIAKATDFTNRYTMNYDAIAPLFKQARQLPMFNLFLSYTVEMGRLLKNLSEDMVMGNVRNGITDHSRHGRLDALLPLATLAIMPEMLQSASEGELSEKDRADWEKAKKLMPDYSRTRYRWVTGRDKNGQFKYIDFTPLIASDAFNQTIKAIAGGDASAVAAVNPIVSWENTPVFNIMRSQATGQDYQTKREFRSIETLAGASDRIASVAKEILPPWTPSVGSEAVRFRQAFETNEEGGQGITNAKTGIKLTPADVWLPYFSGMKSGSVNLTPLQRRVMQETKHEIANEISYLNDVLKSDRPESVKRAAYERTRLVLANLREKYAERIGADQSRTAESTNDVTSPSQ